MGNNSPKKHCGKLSTKPGQQELTKRYIESVMSIQCSVLGSSFIIIKILVLLEGATILLIYYRGRPVMRQFVLAVPLTSRDRLQIQV